MRYLKLDLNDYIEDTYSIIAIHTVMEDFKLAYYINNLCNTEFKRSHNLYNAQLKTTIRGLIWENDLEEEVWYLLTNKLSPKKETNLQLVMDSLSDKNKNIKQFLLPEFKLVDYFIKVPKSSIADKFIKKIKTLSGIEMIYIIPDTIIKSNQNLIFD